MVDRVSRSRHEKHLAHAMGGMRMHKSIFVLLIIGGMAAGATAQEFDPPMRPSPTLRVCREQSLP
jgi:hypothetical protein